MNIENYNPNNNPAYSLHIYRLLKQEKNLLKTIGPPRIVMFKNGFAWYVGWFVNGGGSVDFLGSMYNFSGKPQVYCHINKTLADIEKEVKWAEYERIGCCAISPDYHNWVNVNRNSRKCTKCGEWQRRSVVKYSGRQQVWK